jgi:hypothetical protein
MPENNVTMLHLFSSVAHVWGTWSKNYWADGRKVSEQKLLGRWQKSFVFFKIKLKYPKIKYAISSRPHWRQLDLCEASFLLLNGSH